MAPPKPPPPVISNPKRILLIGLPDSGILEFLTELTGTAPTPPPSSSPSSSTPSLAGLTHLLALTTPYYTATIPIWIDTLPSPPTSPQTWASDFLLPEAREVLAALGGVILLFRKPASAEELKSVKAQIEAAGKVIKEGLDGGIGGNWEGVGVAVMVEKGGWVSTVGGGDGGSGEVDVVGEEVPIEEWEDLCTEGGFEFVDGAASGKKNEFGEKTGIPRVIEALEANDWAADDPDFDLDLENLGEDDDFEDEATEMEMEMLGMKRAIYEGGDVGEEFERRNMKAESEGDEDGVEGLEGLMLRMQGIRDMGADLPEAERKKFAAKAVKDIVKTM